MEYFSNPKVFYLSMRAKNGIMIHLQFMFLIVDALQVRIFLRFHLDGEDDIHMIWTTSHSLGKVVKIRLISMTMKRTIIMSNPIKLAKHRDSRISLLAR